MDGKLEFSRTRSVALWSEAHWGELCDEVREPIESLLGADLRHVWIHLGSVPRLFGAAGLAAGDEIYLSNEWPHLNPARQIQLLVHELTHVVQQRSMRCDEPHGCMEVLVDEELERQAEQMGEQAAQLLLKKRGFLPGEMVRPVENWRPMAVRLETRSERLIIQLALPPGQPNTLNYKPRRSARSIPYRGEDRLGVKSFNANFVEQAIEQWRIERKLNKSHSAGVPILMAVVSEKGKGKQEFPITALYNGTAIDHTTPVKEIGETLMNDAQLIQDAIISDSDSKFLKKILTPEAAKKEQELYEYYQEFFGLFVAKDGAPVKKARSFLHYDWSKVESMLKPLRKSLREGKAAIFPTVYAARKYYHDFDNLKLELSRINSSKGSGLVGFGTTPSSYESDSQEMLAGLAWRIYLGVHGLIRDFWNQEVELDEDDEDINYLNGLVGNVDLLRKFLLEGLGVKSSKKKTVVTMDLGSPLVSKLKLEPQSPSTHVASTGDLKSLKKEFEGI